MKRTRLIVLFLVSVIIFYSLVLYAGKVASKVQASQEIAVSIDIKPGSCPNPFKPPKSENNSGGLLPIAILGSEKFDVAMIDPGSVKLISAQSDGSVPPIRWNYEDVGTPFNGDLCNCHEKLDDGFTDLIMKFKRKLTASELLLNSTQIIRLTIVGNLKEEYGGTPIRGEDCLKVIIQKQR